MGGPNVGADERVVEGLNVRRHDWSGDTSHPGSGDTNGSSGICRRERGNARPSISTASRPPHTTTSSPPACSRTTAHHGGDTAVDSGAIFAGVKDGPDPVPALKRQVAKAILDRLESSVQFRIVRLLGVDQPRASDLRRGNLGRFSLQKLVRLAARLEGEVRIDVAWPTPRIWMSTASRSSSSTDPRS
jgi:predicted XRE-type DNA-binding protein